MTIDEAIAHAQEVADTRTDLCDECKKEHSQIAQWLTELKQLRDSFEKQRSINYELVDENQELINENAELKRLLRLAVEDFERFRCLMSSDINEEFCETALEYNCNPYDLCNSCPLSGSVKCKWQHAEEALKLIGDDK